MLLEGFSNLNYSVIQYIEKLLLHNVHPEHGAGHQLSGKVLKLAMTDHIYT